MIFAHDTQHKSAHRSHSRRGFTTIDSIVSIVIFTAAIVLTAQILVAIASHLRAKRIDFVARQTTENVMEIAAAIPFDQLEQLNDKATRNALPILNELSPQGSEWQIETAVTDIDVDAKRIDVVVSQANRDRTARLSTWRFGMEATDANK